MYFSIPIYNNIKWLIRSLTIGASLTLLLTSSFAQEVKLPNEGMEVFVPDSALVTMSALSDSDQIVKAWNFIKETQEKFFSKEEKTQNDSITYLLSIHYQANLLIKNRQLEKAREFSEKSGKLIEDWSVTHNIVIANHYRRLANLYNNMDLETQDQAIEFCRKALKSYKAGPFQSTPLYRAIIMETQSSYSFSSSVGSADSTLKYLDLQKVLLQQYPEIFQEPGAAEDQLFLGYSRFYSSVGDFTKATSYGLELLNRMDARDGNSLMFRGSYVDNLFWLSINYYYNKQYEESIYHIRNLLPLERKDTSNNEYDMVQYYNLLGLNYEGLNKLDSAMVWFKKCTDILESEGIDNNVYVGLLLNVGSLEARTGNLKSSRRHLEQALSINKRIYGIRHANHTDPYRYLYDHYRKAGDQKKALHYIDSALWTLEPAHNGGIISTPKLKSNLVTFETLEIFHLQMLQQLEVYKEKPESRNNYLDAIIVRAQAIQKILDDKRNSLSESESVLLHSEWFKSAYETVLEALNTLYNENGEMAYLDQAIGYLASGKSRLLVDEMGELRLINSEGIPESLRNQFIQAKKELERLDNELNRLLKTSIDSDSIRILNSQKFEWNNQFNQIRQTLTDDYETSDPLLSPVSDLDQIKALYHIKSDKEVILEYFMGERNITVIALSRNQKQFLQIPRDSAFNETLDKFLEQISSKGNTRLELNEFQNRAYYLYQQLISPVLATVGNNISKLTIIADDQLNLLPFELLVTQNEPSLTSFKNCHYLIRDYIISYQLSVSNMNTAPSTSSGKGILAFGYEGEGISDERAKLGGLPGAREEIQYLKSNFKGRYYKGRSGDKQRFLEKARDYDVLHLALHGKADLSNRFNSSLIFNGETDYSLNSYDLYGIELNPSMVVLSACESGIGKLSSTEGSFSVARGFASVGVPSIVTTLWKVNDQIGAGIVKDFYENLKKGMEKDRALQQAKLSFLESSDSNTAHPYFWGSFIVIGDTSPIELKEAGNTIWYFALTALLILIAVFIILKQRKAMGS